MMYVYIIRPAARSRARAMRAGTGGPEHRTMNDRTELLAAIVAAAAGFVAVVAPGAIRAISLGAFALGLRAPLGGGPAHTPRPAGASSAPPTSPASWPAIASPRSSPAAPTTSGRSRPTGRTRS